MQIDLSNSMGSEVHIINSVLGRRPQGNLVSAKALTDPERVSEEPDLAVILYFAHLVRDIVLDRRQLLRIRSEARLETAGRHLHIQSFMRPDVIIAVTPLVKPVLHALEIGKHSMGQYFNFQSTMKALFLTLRLRVIRAAVTDRYTEMEKPDREWREPVHKIVTPGRSIVHQHPLRQAVTPESGRQMLFHRQRLLVAAGLQTKRISRMIVEYGQRMTALIIAQRVMPLKVHLPELV